MSPKLVKITSSWPELDKKAIIGLKWSKILKLDVPNMFELVQMDKNKISIRFT